MNFYDKLAGITFSPEHSLMVGYLLAIAGFIILAAEILHGKTKIRK